jgi:AAA ATPase containing von Willebrand factor type A (vWA) domain
MKLPILLGLSLLLAARASGALASNADDFFHGGAQLYLSNNIPLAITNVERGLRLFPNDTKLKKLEELLKRQNEQQQSQQQQQQSSPQNQDQQQPEDEKDQDNKDENSSDQQEQNSGKNEQQQNSSGNREEPKNEESSMSPPQKGQMSPEQAERLMDAQKGDEKMLPVNPEKKRTPPSRPLKDW